MKLRRNKLEPFRFEPSGSYIEDYGLSKSEVLALAKELEQIRGAMIESDLDAGFYTQPSRLLNQYENDRRGSELGRLFRVATHMHTIVDRIVVFGDGVSSFGARALMEGCCQPYWNELSRGARGSKPRLYFAGDILDNDATQGLLHLLGVNEGRIASSAIDRWGLVVISKCGETLETATALHPFLAALERSCGDDRNKVRELLVPVTGMKNGNLRAMATERGCLEVFSMPDDVDESYSVLSAVGLVPAAMLGINVIEILQGAVAMNDHFAMKPAEENIILQFVAVNQLLEKQRGINIRIMSFWNNALESVGRWYEQLSAVSLGESKIGFTPRTTGHHRDLPSQHSQNFSGNRDKVVHHIVVDGHRFDDLAIGRREGCNDTLKDSAEVSLPKVMRASFESTNEAFSSKGFPTTSLYMPRVDELHLGQLFQMLMIATALECRLLEKNSNG